MRFSSALLVAFCTLAAPLAARASVGEPNGLAVPIDYTDQSKPTYQASYAEEPLSKFFPSQGETFHWDADAQTTPAVFSPLCGFTAQFVLNQAGNHLGLAWYNATGSAPLASDLHLIVPANSPVGTMISSVSIRNDAAYKGGQVGFALVGKTTQTPYSEQQWNLVYTPNHTSWILALIYKSTKIANAYYIAFEDGDVSSTSFGNDGDFNDDVFLLTGVACAKAGQPCDTGRMGVCAAGLTTCNSAGMTACQQQTDSGPEVCNGLDDDCNGVVDDRATCMGQQLCVKGQCVDPCTASEFGCMSPQVCVAMTCIDPQCVNVTCPAGQACVAGVCQGPCAQVTCPLGEVCRVGRCVDPCAGVTCGNNTVCNGGACVPSCVCSGCGSGQTCQTSTGMCVDTQCALVLCSMGQTCVAGLCVDDCAKARCPSGQECKAGACVDIPIPDMAVPPDLSLPRDLATSDLVQPRDLQAAQTSGMVTSGCTCSTAGRGGGGYDAGLVALALLSLRRRRRR